MKKDFDILKTKNILFLVHNYNNFQKDPIEETSKYFKKVYVLVRYKPISSIVKYLPLKIFKKFDDSYVLDLKALPSNVEVIKCPVWYIPYGFLNRKLGEMHFRAVKKILKKRKIKFDLIHSHFLWSSGYVGMKLKEKYKVPLIVTGHGYDVYKLPFSSVYWKESISRILKSADKVITVSEYNKSYLKKLLDDLQKLEVIYNGYKSEIFHPRDRNEVRKEYGISPQRKVCVAVGNLEKIKGQDILIEAMKRLRDRGEEIFCYIIGNGSKYSYLDSLISKYQLQDRIFLLGNKPHNEVAKYMSLADIFLIPSKRESASVVLLEALACGTPVVATKVGIIPNVLREGVDGYSVEIENPLELSEAINKAFEKKWNPKIISRSVQQLTWEESVKKIIKIYTMVLDNE